MAEDRRVCVEAFFRRRSLDPESVRLVDFEPITGGYSRSMARVRVEDRSGRQGYVVRSEWALLVALAGSGAIPMPTPLWFHAGEELGSPTIVCELVEGQSLLALALQRDWGEHLGLAEGMCQLTATIHGFDMGGLPGHLEVPASWDEYRRPHPGMG